MDYVRFGNAIRLLRQQRGMTRRELADACGLSLYAVGRIERAQRGASVAELVSIANALRVGSDALLLESLMYAINGGASHDISEALAQWMFRMESLAEEARRTYRDGG